MKRTGFKKPTYEEYQKKQAAKRQKLASKPPKAKKAVKTKRKTKKPSIRILKKNLWKECKRITRERFGNICYTCGYQPLEGSNWQTGHGKAKGSLPLKYQYDIRNLRPQCRACNLYNNGETDVFIAKLEQEAEGLLFLQEACYWDDDWQAWRIRRDIPTMSGREATIFIQNLLEEYKNIVVK